MIGIIRALRSWSRSAVHCALNRLQSVDLTFCLTIAPGHVDSAAHGVYITTKDPCETGERRESGMNGIFNPSFELRRISAAKYSAKSRRKAA